MRSLRCLHRQSIQQAMQIGIQAVAHHHQERDPAKHRDAHYWRVSLVDMVKLCRAILPYAVTKRRHLELLLQFVLSRLEGQPLDPIGRVASRSRKPYTAEEASIYERLRQLNLRGPADSARLRKSRVRPAGCHPDRPHAAKGLCAACYNRVRQRGEKNRAYHRTYQREWKLRKKKEADARSDLFYRVEGRGVPQSK